MDTFMNMNNVESNKSWAGALPVAQGLYDPENEKDSCGVGFIASIKGEPSHAILKDAAHLLCNMTHRGAIGADPNDGDGAGVMTGIPHQFLQFEAQRLLGLTLPSQGEYAVGNIFFRPDEPHLGEQKVTFEKIARQYGLKVLGWRTVPVDSSIIGPSARSKEPSIQQPFVVLDPAVHAAFDDKLFNRQLYLLRKVSTHTLTLKNWFYICSLSNKNIVYKGQLSPAQVYTYYYDLRNHEYKTHIALVHSRFSTNTFPSWDRAQPMRNCAHNGKAPIGAKINSLRGNKNWMRAREGLMKSEYFGEELQKLFPIIEEGGSDSSAFDNVLELLLINGVLSLPEAVMMLIPEAWQNNKNMEPEKRAWYEWAACLMEPYDGPALMTFSDGRFCGASLDRNGLRPCRYYKTTDGLMICASEVGTINISPERVIEKGRLQPGKMLLVDTKEGIVVDDRELKMSIATRYSFRNWLDEKMLKLEDIVEQVPKVDVLSTIDGLPLTKDPRLLAFKLTIEQLNVLLTPMSKDGKEALGSMGNDAPLACLSTEPQIIYEYFRQLFAQVTNPPIDPIREEIVMSLECYVGPEGNVLEVEKEQCHKLRLQTPILSLSQMEAIKHLGSVRPDWKTRVIDITFPKSEGPAGYLMCLERVCSEVSDAIHDGIKVVILSDRETNAERVSISSLIATGGVHHYLVRMKQRSRVAIAVETAEAREVHHACVLLGYGADMICSYLAQESILKLYRENAIRSDDGPEKLIYNYIKATSNGILKVMSKMGISTLQSYKGAQIFEALGLDESVIARSFAGTASRIKGVGFELLALDAFAMHEAAWPSRETVSVEGIPESGDYHWRNGGIPHINDPAGIASLQDAVRRKNDMAYEEYSRNAYEQIKSCTLRGMLDFDMSKATPIPIEEVEPWTEICKRFCTGAMSYGSISMEAHSTLSIAMNRIGGKSNTGEGGEDPARSIPRENGDSLRSAIKQIASGRFGVTSYYLADADEIQIKMAQGAKPGEGGELPGHKVSNEIGKTRHSTPGVGLISPPPHHDIYSIEDLKQLIYDAKAANPRARVSVKLVSEVGVGVIASGVAKAKADHILISGHDGGTGASRWTGIKYAGLPWELGLAETHQTLVLNDLRGRVIVQTDGQIRTGRDVVIAGLLGAEEWGFATTPLIAMGCTMMRKCHLNTCPVGVATQDPHLRAKFAGSPEHVINFFHYVAEEARSYMAKLGFRSVTEMVGRTDLLHVNDSLRNPKTSNIDLSPILTPAFTLRPGAATFNVRKQEHMHHTRIDNKFITESEAALNTGKRVTLEATVVNTDRALGTTVSYEVSKRYGEQGLPDDTIHINLKGSAGQSLGAWLAPGVTIELEGDSNDYVGKGLSGGRLIVYPPKVSSFKSEENVIVGNTCLYGATSGKAFISGIAAERFAVRNSGATAVIEGTGDHGCEYMTGGRVIVLGSTGRNFAAGMSGGIAYVLDLKGDFKSKVNMEMVEFETVNDTEEIAWFRDVLEDHRHFTGSAIADRMLKKLGDYLPKVVKVMPTDYKQVLEAQRAAKKAAVEQPQQPQTTATVAPAPASSKANEPALVDLEDSMLDSETYKKRSEMVDKVRGFMKYKRRGDNYRNPKKRVKDWKEVSGRLSDGELQVQAARCMDCGVPFCQSTSTGCPIGNIIPKWNDLVFKDQWEEALNRLLMTNNFPEFTGRVCPAPCENSCVLGINELPVSIKSIEAAIIDRGFEMGWLRPRPPTVRTGKRVAIIGAGPAGLAAADQLNKAGHLVTVYDRNDRMGGLLMYGIPNMKLDKKIVQRRLDLMAAEGIQFVPNAHVGVTHDVAKIQAQNDAVVVSTGATWPRDLPIPNRNLNGVHFAMEFLQKNTQSLLDSELNDGKYISAKGKNVVVIGGGDTGCDCIGTSVRHGATSVVNFELLPQPPATRAKDNPWPQFAKVLKYDYGHTEAQVMLTNGKDPREYNVLSKEFVSDGQGNVKGINTIRVEWTQDDKGRWSMKEVAGSEQYFQADLVLLSMGFMGPESELLKGLGVKQDMRSNIETPKDGYTTSVPGVFAAGDCRRGQSLIVWGINEGRQCARQVDEFLTGSTLLPVTGGLPKRSIKALEAQTQRHHVLAEIAA
ncbi:glutamate synthase [NADH] [Actinomortierella ambigua]|uniref:Glutamate synthase [NADH] n=1 Tax=Actinomortierella ambigua TaxID=1343610 RepID=A0A9P6UC90_9FUNG|nr:glutamate synthase [NADH] [Actinomortierella ambigua]